MFEGDFKQDFGGASWGASALLPILQGTGTDAQHGSKLRLGQAEFAPDSQDISPGINGRNTRGLEFAFLDGFGLFDTLQELLK